MLKPGDVVEHFVIVSLLGQGGMGQVFAARDTRLQRVVALKIVHPGEGASESAKGSDGAARLVREAQSAAALEHPNVVTIYEVGEIRSPGEEHGRPFIAMELVKGRSLASLVGDASVTLEQKLRWLADVARALAAAHRVGLVHRDVKPENVMVRDDGGVKVLDFGVAKRAVTPSTSASTSTEAQLLPSLTAKGVAVGTPYYMAPEQMRREPLDGRADQFAWGVVAYELLAGAPPWGRQLDALELVSKILSDEPPPLREVCPAVPAHIAAVVARAMAKKRGERFPSMDELLAAFEDPRGALVPTAPLSIAVTPSAEVPTALPARGERRTWRPRAIALAWLVGATFLVSGGFVASRRMRSGAAAANPVALSECSRNTECVAKSGGQPAVCHAGKCAAIASAECKALFEPGDLARDDTVWLGAMFPLSGDAASFGRSNLNAVELARRDFVAASSSLRLPAGGPVRPIALVACDDAAGPERATDHLLHDLAVPAVVGFRGPYAVDLLASRFVPSNVMAVVTLTLTPLLARIPHAQGQDRLVWRTTYDSTDAARALAALVPRLASDARGAQGGTRVALVRRRDMSSIAFAQAFFAALRFNGRSALENGESYREFGVDVIDGSEVHLSVARDVAAFNPTVIVVPTDSTMVRDIEEAWPREAKRRPYYVTPTTLDDELLGFASEGAGRRQRVWGLTTVSTTLPNARFVLHYNETFPEPITRTWAPNSSYDAFYVVAYASYAVGGSRVDGPALARAMAHLIPPGAPVDVGPSEILGAFGLLARGENIDLRGATGELDFDLKTGEAPSDFTVLCAALGTNGGRAQELESGLVYDARSRTLVNEPHCP